MDPTAILAIIVVLAFAALELYFVVSGQATITARTRALNARWPTLGAGVCLVVGILLGHLFLT